MAPSKICVERASTHSGPFGNQSITIAFAVFVQNGGHGGTVGAPIARAVLERFFAKQDLRGGGDRVALATPR